MHPATSEAAAGPASEHAAREWDVPPTAGIENDPLLGCLIALTRLFNQPTSADTLIAGLPLIDQRLTPALFIRAAARVGISAKLNRRPLESITDLVLPAVLLLHDKQACVLLRRTSGGSMQIILPETGDGEQEISVAELQEPRAAWQHRIQERPIFVSSPNRPGA